MSKNDKLFSLDMLENSENTVLERVADRINDEDTYNASAASHSSHSSSSGRGHSSYVSGSVGSMEKKAMKKKNQQK